MKQIISFLFFLSILQGSWKEDREELQYFYAQEPFRIFYSLQGKNQLHDKTDNNHNNVPDIIESFMEQLKKAEEVLQTKRGLKHPLKSRRYKDKVQYIDIHMLDLEEKHGSAGDAMIRYHYHIIDDNAISLSIALSTRLNSRNLSPTHELIHLYQNGYSMIKTRWYTEGVARLLEKLLRTDQATSDPLPKNKIELESVFQRTYANANFFQRFEEICEEENFIRDFLHSLAEQDKAIEERYAYIPFKWNEEAQKSHKNTSYILKALHKSIKKNCPIKNTEVQLFLKISKEYLN